MRASFAFYLLLAQATGCAPTELAPSAFPARYSPQGGTYESPPGCASFRSLTAVDGRPSDTAGKRFLEDQPAKEYPISMNGDVPAMLTSAARRAFAALQDNPKSNVEVKLALTSLMIDEKTSRNSSYNATLVLEAQVINGGSHQVVWQARKSGQGGNYGEAGSAVNYQETVSRALEEALAALLHDQEFAHALCHPEAAPPAAPAAAAPAAS